MRKKSEAKYQCDAFQSYDFIHLKMNKMYTQFMISGILKKKLYISTKPDFRGNVYALMNYGKCGYFPALIQPNSMLN